MPVYLLFLFAQYGFSSGGGGAAYAVCCGTINTEHCDPLPATSLGLTEGQFLVCVDVPFNFLFSAQTLWPRQLSISLVLRASFATI